MRWETRTNWDRMVRWLNRFQRLNHLRFHNLLQDRFQLHNHLRFHNLLQMKLEAPRAVKDLLLLPHLRRLQGAHLEEVRVHHPLLVPHPRPQEIGEDPLIDLRHEMNEPDQEGMKGGRLLLDLPCLGGAQDQGGVWRDLSVQCRWERIPGLKKERKISYSLEEEEERHQERKGPHGGDREGDQEG